MNNQIEELHQNLIDVLNNCTLPIGIAFYVFKDVMSDLDKIYAEAITKERNNSLAESEE